MGRLGRFALWAGAFAAVAVGASALTRATTASSVIHACVNRKTGSLRVVSAKHGCRRLTERRLAWNQRGRAGLAGVTGAAGAPGAAGATGPAGTTGPQGPPGPTWAATRTGATATDPAATPDEPLSSAVGVHHTFDFTTPSDGKVYLRMFETHWQASCSAGSATAGLYLDGRPVPASRLDLVGNGGTPDTPVMLAGVISAGAGAHTASAQFDCPSGDQGPSSTPNTVQVQWTAQLLGG